MVADFTVGNLLWQNAGVGRNTPWTVTRSVNLSIISWLRNGRNKLKRRYPNQNKPSPPPPQKKTYSSTVDLPSCHAHINLGPVVNDRRVFDDPMRSPPGGVMKFDMYQMYCYVMLCHCRSQCVHKMPEYSVRLSRWASLPLLYLPLYLPLSLCD